MKTLAATLSLACLLALSAEARAELPLILKEDFSKGADRWEPTDAKAWKVTTLPDGNAVFDCAGGSKYEPPHRSPFNIALLKDVLVGDFVLTARVMTKQSSRAHRDMCLFFGYQDPANFYYVHLGEKTDDHANQIFIVNDAPRVKISEKASAGTPWKDETWHQVKIVREAASGLIEVYFDDMTQPTHVAHDKNFIWGRIGIGTFDDLGWWDDVELHGVKVEKPAAAADPAPAAKNATAGGHPDPKILGYTKWTPDFQVPDPVAISLDANGVAYVTQTQRRKSQDLDIRQNLDWIPDDLSFISVEDKRAFYLERLTTELSDKNRTRVEDLNGDGSHDYRDLTVLSEIVHRIADTDGDGLADEMKPYADGFNTEITGIAAGVLVHEGNVYATIAPDVWKMRDTDGDGRADRREVLAHGFGMHIAYAGHDMHGLIVGPDGRIYWSIGDKGVRVKTREGRDYRYPFEGAVLRCEPDGSHFEVFAHGLRNVQEIDFDAHGNWFGVDNDADMKGEMERFVYIVNQMDAGWRANWQYRGTDFNPWMDEGLSIPWHAGQPAYVTPAISQYVNGPAGFKWNPGTALGEPYRDYFFLTSAPNGQQYAFQAREKGASFEMVNEHQIGTGIPLVGLSFGPDGALYGVDWGGGYPLNQKGAVWRIDIPGEADSEIRKDTARRLRADVTAAPAGELTDQLGHADRRVRLKAQFELARRDAFAELAAVSGNERAPRLARIHALWGLGQLTRYREGADWEPLLARLADPDAEIRAQAARLLGDGFAASVALSPAEFPNQQGRLSDRNLLHRKLIPLLKDTHDRVRFHAAIALGHLGISDATQSLIAFLETVKAGDTYLRHAGVVGLTGCADSATLGALGDHASAMVRAAAVVALRRREDAAVAAFLSDPDPEIAAEAARAIHDDWSIPDALPALAAALETSRHRANEPFARRAVGANFRLGTAEHAARVAAYAADPGLPAILRREAFDALGEWTKPPVLDRVVGWHRPLPERDPAVVKAALEGHVDALLTDASPEIQRLTMELAQELSVSLAPESLVAFFRQPDGPGGLRAQALRSLAAEEADALDDLLSPALKDRAIEVRRAALDLLAARDTARAAAELTTVLDSDREQMTLRQHAIGLLPTVGASSVLAGWLGRWKDAPAALRLDLWEAAAHPAFVDDAAVSQAFGRLRESIDQAAATDPLAAFAMCLEGGDPQAGERVIQTNVASQCVACHQFGNGPGSTVGPNLKSIGREKDRAYLLESLVNPQATVTPGYGMITLTLQSGESIAGQFRGEKNGIIELRDPAGQSLKVKAAEVKERSPVISTMPPMGLILSKREVRDIVAYLASLKAKK
ncbi:MAG: HEAT repeat domain-containing protein [Verrucomicrobiales bacterium]|nr:HEAT repeat domain-containing protein [Verrucomicrobiales bacterium]